MQTTHHKNSHCSFCGAPFVAEQPWPRICGHCGNVSYVNPLPVAVVVVPVGAGVVLIRRGIEPRRGHWALPGGFIHLGETWQQAGAREVLEETGIEVEPQTIRHLDVCSAPDGTLLVFGVASPLRAGDLPAFQPVDEALERKIVLHPPQVMAFELHRQALAQYFKLGRQDERL